MTQIWVYPSICSGLQCALVVQPTILWFHSLDFRSSNIWSIFAKMDLTSWDSSSFLMCRLPRSSMEMVIDWMLQTLPWFSLMETPTLRVMRLFQMQWKPKKTEFILLHLEWVYLVMSALRARYQLNWFPLFPSAGWRQEYAGTQRNH